MQYRLVYRCKTLWQLLILLMLPPLLQWVDAAPSSAAGINPNTAIKRRSIDGLGVRMRLAAAYLRTTPLPSFTYKLHMTSAQVFSPADASSYHPVQVPASGAAASVGRCQVLPRPASCRHPAHRSTCDAYGERPTAA